MAPIMFYCSIINLLWSLIVDDEYTRNNFIYNQIIPPKSEATHVTPVREQGL